MEDLELLRSQIDEIDDGISDLWLKRMAKVKEIATIKEKIGKKINDGGREDAVLFRLAEKTPEELKIYLKEVYASVFATSKAYQSVSVSPKSATIDAVKEKISSGLKDFPVSGTVACQGINGANSGIAAKTIFPINNILYFKNFEGVFNAVEKGLCKYGVLPIENSTAGSVSEVYDLMKKHKFYIVRSVRLRIDHCLAALDGAELKGITEVYSHPQALSQCAEHIKKWGAKPCESENTATAARDLVERGLKNQAVLCSRECAEKYGLKILESSVQDNPYNFTRFICISKDLEIYSEAEKISVMTSLSHEPGSLNRTLARFAALGLNLTKIESRPVLGSQFEFMFYFDFEGSILSEKVQSVIAELENTSERFVLLGSYKEIV